MESMRDMAMSTSTATGTSAAAATGTAMNMGGGSMNVDIEGDSCKVSMLWNWDTVDACFISSTWHIRSGGMFAGSCIGVILLAVLFEALRRTAEEYDSYLANRIARQGSLVAASAIKSGSNSPDPNPGSGAGPRPSSSAAPIVDVSVASSKYTPKIHEQAIRAFLYTAQFVVAYFLMMLSMYYNGFIIICIFVGAYIGSFVFRWEKLDARQNTSAANEATACCG
ncbi:Ctr copper transporter family-domain-containing protein [Durotheca rogersii]|uniref:Ctr copper transporter family-domain-containing protein n=1 Tax=Durotheca rogersii TaxID=419775 RepID=UPI00222102CF|nr:Ctr copper transporter family-domain-containing protein [Durotheca rogersii]KAI5865799.1 Ctr copper transporter family-domain-containing protein [Durotheca rogersii]